MRKTIYLYGLITLLGIQFSYAQSYWDNKNAVTLQYGISTAIIPTSRDGAPSLDGYSHRIGIQYYRDMSYDLGFETGLSYSKSFMNISGIDGEGNPYKNKYESSYIHIPLLMQYNFMKYLFVQLGPTASFQVDNSSSINKSGIGLWGAVGVQFSKNNFLFKANPYFHSQDIIGFAKDNYQSQQNMGANIGIGMKF